MASEKRLAELTDFEGVLDTFGSDPARWPSAKRERLLDLAAADRDARQLLSEARALDAVLAHGAGPAAGSAVALADRIAAAAMASKPPTSAASSSLTERVASAPHDAASSTREKPGVVIAWPKADTAAHRTAALSGPAPHRERAKTQWRTAAALAASLVLGIFAGAMDIVPSGFSGLVPGVEASSDTPRELALLQGDDLLDFLDERSQ
jgi:hypothetical protein